MKKCSQCGETKPLHDFHKRKDSKDGYRSNCKDCSRAVIKRHYEANRDEYLRRNKISRAIRVLRVKELKEGLSCTRCSESRSVCLDFHHVDPAEKEFSISEMIRMNCSDEQLQAEIAKCIVLCSNCHRVEHFGER